MKGSAASCSPRGQSQAEVGFSSDPKKTERSVWGKVCLGAQSFPTLCGPTDCSPPDSSVHGIFQARTLGWIAMSFFMFSVHDETRACACMLSCVRLFVTPRTVARQTPVSSPDKNTGVGCHAPLQVIFQTQGSNPHLLHLRDWQLDPLPLSYLMSHIFGLNESLYKLTFLKIQNFILSNFSINFS